MSWEIAVILLVVTLQSTAIKVTTSRGAYFGELQDMIIYEKTVPIIYTVNVPLTEEIDDIEKSLDNLKICDSEAIRMKECVDISGDQRRLIKLTKEFGKINRAILNEFVTIVDGKKRFKRGLQFLGDIQNWCCNVLTVRQGKPLWKDVCTLKEGYDMLRESVIHHHEELLNTPITTEVKAFAAHTYDFLSALRHDLQVVGAYENGTWDRWETTIKINHKVQATYNEEIAINSKLLYLTHSCKNNRLPSSIIPRTTLLEDLKRVRTAANKNNFDIVLNEDQINSYFHLKLLNCYFHNDTLELEVKVPIVTTGSSYKVYEVITLEFKSHENRLCMWDGENTILISEETTGNLRTITGNNLEFCNKKDKLCYITEYRTINAQGACARALFMKRGTEEVNKACSFKCSNNHGNIIVKQMAKDTFVITNARTPLIITNTLDKNVIKQDFNDSWPGAIIANVPCTHEVAQINNEGSTEIIIPSGMPCMNDPIKIKFEHHLPSSWTKFDFIETNDGIEQSFRYPNLSVLYNEKWDSYVPNFSPIEPVKDLREKLTNLELKIPLWESSMFSLIHIIMLTWLCLLTLIFGLIIACYFKVYSEKKALERIVTVVK